MVSMISVSPSHHPIEWPKGLGSIVAGCERPSSVDHTVRMRAAGLKQVDPIGAGNVHQLDAIGGPKRSRCRRRLAPGIRLVSQKPRVPCIQERLRPRLERYLFEIDQARPRTAADRLVVFGIGRERLSTFPESSCAEGRPEIDRAVGPTRCRSRGKRRAATATLRARRCRAEHCQRAREKKRHLHSEQANAFRTTYASRSLSGGGRSLAHRRIEDSWES